MAAAAREVMETGGIAVDVVLNEYELRVIGASVEKQIATPDYYPMTLNALVNAFKPEEPSRPRCLVTTKRWSSGRSNSLREKN